MEKTWCIYCHTNIINGKRYIGQTSQSLDKRWQNGFGYREGTYIRKAIDKYGWENFKHEILEEGLTLNEANEREQYYIQLYKSYDAEYGYNLTMGGRNGVPNEETKKILSEKAKLRVGELNNQYGKHFSDEHKKKLSISNRESAMSNPIKCIETGKVYKNAHDAGRETGANYTSILRCCKGVYKQTKGLHFEYEEAKLHETI